MCGYRSIAAAGTLALAQVAAAQGQIGIEPVPGGGVDPPDFLLGTWGTAVQCASSDPPSPYRIEREWIEQGGVYCLVTWQANHARDGRVETQAFARCGEDTLREYQIFLLLDAGRLRIRWSDSYTTPALSRCR